jgi:hypothetical protein
MYDQAFNDYRVPERPSQNLHYLGMYSVKKKKLRKKSLRRASMNVKNDYV